MKINRGFMALLVLIIFFGGITLTIALDVWSTTTDKIPVKFSEGEFEGEFNPEDIRGSYTFDDVATIFDVDIMDLFEAFGIPKDTDPTLIKNKDLEVLYSGEEVEIGNGSVKVFVALYKNLPVVLDDEYLLKQAVDILLEVNQELTQEQIAYLNDHQITVEANAIEAQTENDEEEHAEGAVTVKGTTTFQMLLDQGITQEQIEAVLGRTMPATNQLIRDFCVNEGMSFSIVKDELNALFE